MNTFPLDFSKHVIFCIVGIAFFLFQFYRQGFKYQLLTAAAIGITLLLHINDSPVWRYTIGIVEAVLLAAIFIIMTAEKNKAAKAAEAAKTEAAVSEPVPETENSSSAEEASEKTETVSDGDSSNE